MSTIHDPRYLQLIESLIQIRNEKNITQTDLAKKLQKPQSYCDSSSRTPLRQTMAKIFYHQSITETLDCKI